MTSAEPKSIDISDVRHVALFVNLRSYELSIGQARSFLLNVRESNGFRLD